jgi:hypothetical protein
MEEFLKVIKDFVAIPIGLGVVLGIEFIKKQTTGWVQKHPNTMSIFVTIFFTVAAALAGIITWQSTLLQAGLSYLVANILYSMIIKRIKDFLKIKKEGKNGTGTDK